MESWSGVEWSWVWSGVESTLYSCNLGRAWSWKMSLPLKTQMTVQFRTSNGDVKDAKKKRIAKTLSGLWIYMYMECPWHMGWVLWFGDHFQLRNECLFFWVHGGMNRSAGQTNRVNREAVLVRFVCSALRFIPHEHREKRHSFLIFTMPPTKNLSKILRGKI